MDIQLYRYHLLKIQSFLLTSTIVKNQLTIYMWSTCGLFDPIDLGA